MPELIFKIFFCFLLGISTLSIISSVGKERTPITNGTAMASVILNTFLIWGIVYLV